MKRPLSALVVAFAILAALNPINGAGPKKSAGVRLHLTPEQLDVVGSGKRLALSPEQRKQVLAKIGKEVPDVGIVYDQPDGEVSELGYNLALRDQPDSILLLSDFAMDPAKVAAKRAQNSVMIGKPENPGRENASFFIDAQGRIWRFVQHDEFTEYVQSHNGHFGYVDISTRLGEDSRSLAYRDTERFMKRELENARALVTP